VIQQWDRGRPDGDWIHELDLSVGGILETLDRKQFAGDTLVIFTSDDGGVYKPHIDSEQTGAFNAGLKVNGPFRGGKHSVYEGGFRVPFLARWPGMVPADTVCHEMLSLADLLATVAAVVGETLPPREQAAEDSYNLLPALLGQEYAGPLRPDTVVHSADGNFAIRQGSWKWIEGKCHPATKKGVLRVRAEEFKSQLYNLDDDRAEKRDALNERPAVADRLRAALDRCREQGYSRP
jgi:arylsulfatase A